MDKHPFLSELEKTLVEAFYNNETQREAVRKVMLHGLNEGIEQRQPFGHGLLYLVMPILKESLRDRMAREGAFAPSEAGRIVVQVASALDAAMPVYLPFLADRSPGWWRADILLLVVTLGVPLWVYHSILFPPAQRTWRR